MWLKGLILALFLPTGNQSPINQSIMARLIQINWHSRCLCEEYAYQIGLTCRLYFLRKSGKTEVQEKIVSDHVTSIKAKGQIYTCQKISHAYRRLNAKYHFGRHNIKARLSQVPLS